MIEPVDPFQRGELDGFEGSPRATAMDDFGLVEAVDRFGQGVVIAVADAADRGFDAGLRQAFGVSDRQVLTAAIAMVDQATAAGWSAVVDRLLQGVERDLRASTISRLP